MNKTRIKSLLFIFAIISSAIIYKNFYAPSNNKETFEISGNIKEVSMRVLKGKWEWSPKAISANVGDKIILKIFNEDNFFHGFALDAFSVNKKLEPNKETVIEFIVQDTGEFSYYCSIPCGEGHYNQRGHLTVEEIAEKEAENNLNGLLIVTDSGLTEARMK